MKKILAIALLAFVLLQTANAVTAYPELIKFMQPDKTTTLMLYLKGDERVHWAETVDGYSLVTNDGGFFVYATTDEMGNMVPSPFVATDVDQRSQQVRQFLEQTPKHLFFSKMQVDAMKSIWRMRDNMENRADKVNSSISGNRKILVILMGFRDKRFITLRSMVNSLFNNVNYTTTGVYGSVHDYYYENSYGQLNLTADVKGPYTCDSNAAFYGRNDNQSVGYQSFATEAIMAAAPHVDFSDYDGDGDGVVDCIHILFAGYGEEAGGGADCIWSHKWNLFQPLRYNNTDINTYSCSPEFGGNSNQSLTKIGVVCHEIGHVFGAPDFYDTDYEGSGGQYPGTGKWDLMASGSWNVGGASPAHHNPYTKSEIYGWTSLKTLSTPSCYTLLPSSTDSTSFYKLNTTTPGEYYIVENRQQINFDRGLPGHGMILYHLNSQTWSNTTHPQFLYVVSATQSSHIPAGPVATYAGVDTPEAPFPGNTGANTLNDTTKPALISWAGNNSSHRLSFIGENQNSHTVSFVYNDGCSPEATNFSGEGVSGNAIQLSWTPFGGQKVMVVVNDTDNFTAPQQIHYHAGDVLATGERVVIANSSDIHTLCNGLQPQTTYYFRLYTMLTDTTYTSGLPCAATTLCQNLGYPFKETFQMAEGSTFNCWHQDTTQGVHWQKQREGINMFLSLVSDTGTQAGSALMRISPLNLEGGGNLVLLLDVRNPLRYDTINDTTILPILDTLIVKYRNADMYQWQTLRMFFSDIPDWQQFTIPLPNVSNDYLIALDGHFGGQTLSVDNVRVSTVHLVSVTTDGHGTVYPGSELNSVAVPDGESITFNIVPDNGYELSQIYVDYQLQPRRNPFTLTSVSEPHVLYVTFAQTLSLDEPYKTDISLYPNPANTLVAVSVNNGQAAQYTLYDMSGRFLTNGSIAPGTPAQIDVQSLAAGVYYIKVVGHDFKTTEKIVVTKR